MKYIVKKCLALIITLFLVSFLTFFAFQVIPGDSAVASLGTTATKEAIEALREELGLNQNVFIRFFTWMGSTLKGDFGQSLQYNIPVKTIIGERLPATLGLALISTIIILILSIPLGVLAAEKEGSFLERAITLLTHTSMAIPPFFLGMIITLIFGFTLKWFVPGKYISPSENFGQFLGFMIFPSLAIAIPKIAMVAEFLRSSIVQQLKQDYVRTARSKGHREHTILYKHILKNALIPVVTFVGIVIAEIMAGSIIVEQVFGLPGLGRLLVNSISNRDFPVVQIIILYIAFIVVFINFIVDILYRYIDPRVRV